MIFIDFIISYALGGPSNASSYYLLLITTIWLDFFCLSAYIKDITIPYFNILITNFRFISFITIISEETISV